MKATDSNLVVLFEGFVDGVTFRLNAEAHLEISLFQISEKLIIPDLHHISPGDRLRAICGDKPTPNGHFQVIDFIRNDNSRPFTDEQRASQLRRMQVSPIYRADDAVTPRAVISTITEIEQQLIMHLRRNPEVLREMHSDAFEKLVAEIMASHGFDVEWTGRNKSTAGDVIAFRTDPDLGLLTNYIVECKRYSENRSVGIEVARALYGAKVDERYSNALLVTTSHFQEGVEQFALRRWDFQTKDFNGLVDWLNKYRPKSDGRLYMEDRRIKRELK